MNKWAGLVFALQMLLFFATGSALASDTRHEKDLGWVEIDAQINANVEALIRPLVEADLISGSILVARGDKLVLAKGFGLADREHTVTNTPDTAFRIASISKSITAVAILQLIEGGKLTLGTKLESVIPGFTQGEQITISHLLDHTSGIPSDVYLEGFRENSSQGMTLDEAVEWVRGAPPRFEAGDHFEYSNSGYLLLSAIVEKVSGMGFEEYLRQNIFEPAEMTNSGLDRAAFKSPARAKGYSRDEMGHIVSTAYRDPEYGWGYGALYSSVMDMFAFSRALMNNTLLSEGSRRLMWLERNETPWKNQYGLGWFINEAHGKKIITAWGSTGGFVGTLRHFTKDSICLVVLLNRDFMLDTELYEQLSGIVLSMPWKPLLGPKEELEVEKMFELVGSYLMEDGVRLELKLDGSRLAFGDPKEGKLFEAHVVSEYVLYVPAQNARLIFRRNAAQETKLFALYGNLAWRGKRMAQ